MPRMPTRSSHRPRLLLLGAALLLGATAAAAQSEATVIISDGVEPASLEVAAGDTVTWRNEDDERHRIRSREGPAEFDSGNLEPGEAFAFTFVAEGSYPYRDERDDSATAYAGTIVVGPTEAATGGASEPAGSFPDAPPPSTASVAIADRAFAPASVEVAAGGTVEWTNADGEGHTVSATGGAFESGIMPEGAVFAQVFETPGVFDYVCAIHPEMRGTVTVAEPGAAAASSPVPLPIPTVSDAPAVDIPVSIVDMVYAPATVEVSAGTTVHWRNDDAVVHTVTARDGSFNSGVMKTGVEFSQTFDEPGTYDYFCAIHPLQGGRIVVTDPGG